MKGNAGRERETLREGERGTGKGGVKEGGMESEKVVRKVKEHDKARQ